MMIQGVSDGGPDGATTGAWSADSFFRKAWGGGWFARAQELGPWLDLIAVRGEVVVQFWLRPGETAVTLGTGEDQELERIPEPLRRFL